VLKSDKERVVAELTERLKSTSTLFVADYRGLSVKEIDDLRTKLIEHGAREVYAVATHGVLSGPAIDRIKNSVISKVVITNTLPLPPEKQIDKIEVLSVAGIIAAAIDAVFEDTSVSGDLRRRQPGLRPGQPEPPRAPAGRLAPGRGRPVA